ncbi:MAG: DUF952 domain-containing protein [Planctomycetota bacterium]
MNRIVYKIAEAPAWKKAEAAGEFVGAPIDLEDGFIHFSAADQVVETAQKHFAGKSELLLVAVNSNKLGADLKWEPSRGGSLFPHLYANLPMTAVIWVKPLPQLGDGFQFPELPDEIPAA